MARWISNQKHFISGQNLTTYAITTPAPNLTVESNEYEFILTSKAAQSSGIAIPHIELSEDGQVLLTDDGYSRADIRRSQAQAEAARHSRACQNVRCRCKAELHNIESGINRAALEMSAYAELNPAFREHAQKILTLWKDSMEKAGLSPTFELNDLRQNRRLIW